MLLSPACEAELGEMRAMGERWCARREAAEAAFGCRRRACGAPAPAPDEVWLCRVEYVHRELQGLGSCSVESGWCG